ncbi:MAG: hypothetical protein ABW128_05460, partial [Rhizorhabdus sp.]
ALLIASAGLSGCSEQVDDREIIRTVLRHEFRDRQADDKACVLAEVLFDSGERDNRLAILLDKSSMPKDIPLCQTEYNKVYYQVFKPSANKLLALVDVDFHCGGMCGGGTTYELRSVNEEWKIVGENPRWRS